jgi:Tfp pilus assembly protein PilE
MRQAGRGFTIVEVMIFLAISGAMFIIAYFGMRQQQDGVSFRQALNSIELKIREVFNNVDNGYFGNIGEYTCSTSGSPNYQVAIDYESGSTSGGGNSGDCVFIGKVIDFESNDSQMDIETLVGSRLAPTLEYGTSLIEVSELAEQYEINNSIQWTGSYLYNATSGQYSNITDLRVSAQRDRNTTTATQADLRASRNYYANGAWNNVSNNNLPMFCFGLGDLKGSVTITQKDITVSYAGEGCQ